MENLYSISGEFLVFMVDKILPVFWLGFSLYLVIGLIEVAIDNFKERFLNKKDVFLLVLCLSSLLFIFISRLKYIWNNII